jgi:ATP-dependent helicase/nuclease subunit B
VRVIFDAALDGPSWPGPLGRADFAFGEVWLGPLGILDLLETRLGLGGRLEEPLQRACRLAAGLRDLPGSWRQSFEVDPLGTSRRLLRDRDELRLWGWTGQPVSLRLQELAAATADASPGIPDRLMAVVQALGVRRAGRSTGIESLVSCTDISSLAPLWRALFEGLRRAGVAVEERPQTRGFAPQEDRRVCLLRRHGALDLADEVAASLAACDSLDGVVLIGADSVLDAALARHGLPRVGAHAGPPASSRLLSLVLEAAFHPMEMGDLHALLVASPGPVPRAVAAKLMTAIRQFPGRRTAAWKEALAAGLAHIDEERREDVEKRLTDLLSPVCGRAEKLSIQALGERMKALDAWARARVAFDPSLLELASRIRSLLQAIDLWQVSALSWDQVRRLCDNLGEPAWTWQPAQAGLAHVARPGAILAPARAIVWWNFSRDEVPRPERVLLTRAERDGLRAVGAEAPDPALAMAIETEGWRRPFLQAEQALILACPLIGPNGEPNHPHPLWDDVTAARAETADVHDARLLERDHITHLAPARLVPAAPLRLVAPAPVVTLRSAVALRDVESPSSLEELLGCPLSWALHYRARLRPGLAAGPPPPGPLLFGTLAHWILAKVLDKGLASPDAAAALAEAIFDQSCDDLYEDLALPRHQAARATVRHAVVQSARELLRLAQKHGASGMKTEIPGQVVAAGQAVTGRLDLVWDDPAVVLDLKWGKNTYIEKLQTGTAIQLANYAAMRETAGRPVETAYFVLRSQELLPEPGGRFATEAKAPGTHRASDVWPAATAALERRRDAMAGGRLEAPGAAGEPVKSALSPAGLEVAPPCKHCDYPGLCGRGQT